MATKVPAPSGRKQANRRQKAAKAGFAASCLGSLSTARENARLDVSTNSVENNKRVTTFLARLTSDQYTAFRVLTRPRPLMRPPIEVTYFV